MTPAQERAWVDVAANSEKLVAKLGPRKEVAPLLDIIRELDVAAALAGMEKQLRATWRHYAEYASGPPATMLDVLWGEDDVLVGRLRAGSEAVMNTRDIFTPMPLPLLADAVAESPALANHPSFSEVRAIFVAKSLVLARSAFQSLADHKTFAVLETARPFTVKASPPIDGKRLVLHVVR